MGRKSNKEERRAQIVAALLSVMKDYGYEKATIQSIAKAAGLAPGLIHYHFKTKQDILITLVEQMVVETEQRYQALSESVEGSKKKLEALIDARLALGKGANANAVAAWVVIGAEAVRQPEVQNIYQKVVRRQLELISDLIAEILKEKNKPVKLAKPLAASVVGNLEGAFQLSAAAGDVMPKDYAAEMLKLQLFAFLDA